MLNLYQIVFIFHQQLSAITVEYEAENERFALEEALLDLNTEKKYKLWRELNIKQITIHRIK